MVAMDVEELATGAVKQGIGNKGISSTSMVQPQQNKKGPVAQTSEDAGEGVKGAFGALKQHGALIGPYHGAGWE